jgi:hypothetical protein
VGTDLDLVLLGKYFGTFLQLIENLIDNPAEVRVRLASHHQECAKGPPPTSVIRRLINSHEIQLHCTKKSSLYSTRTIYCLRPLTTELEILIFDRHHSAIADKPRLVPPSSHHQKEPQVSAILPSLSIRCSAAPLGPRLELPSGSLFLDGSSSSIYHH